MVINCQSAGIEQTFPCNKWLARDEDDRVIERRLEEAKHLRKERKPSTYRRELSFYVGVNFVDNFHYQILTVMLCYVTYVTRILYNEELFEYYSTL